MVALIGPSGSGKSTLLRSLTGFKRHRTPTAGPCPCSANPCRPRAGCRTRCAACASRIGFIFQQFNPGRPAQPLLQRRARHARPASASGARPVRPVAGHGEDGGDGGPCSAWVWPTMPARRPRPCRAASSSAAPSAPGPGAEGRGPFWPTSRWPRSIPVSARRVMQLLSDLNREDGLAVVVTLHQVDYAMRLLPAHRGG